MIKQKRKIAVVLINRTNYGRLKSILRAIQEHPQLELQLIVGSSLLLERFGKGINILKQDGFSPDVELYMNLEGETPLTMTKSVSIGLMELPTIFNTLKPDIVLVNADRFEIIAAAISASYMNIPIAHTLGGEITGSIDESVRHAITKFANIHFPATKKAAGRIIQMGEDPETVFVVGNAALDIINKIDLKLDQETFWQKYGGVGPRLDLSRPYLLAIQHPVTTEYLDAKMQIEATLDALRELQLQTILLWPNIDAGSDGVSKGIRVFREDYQPSYVYFLKNVAVEDYLRLIKNSVCIIGNSSSGIIEASYLGTPAVNIGTRQQGRERGKNVIDVGYNKDEVKKAILKQIEHGEYEPEYIYGQGETAKKIVNILADFSIKSIQKKFYDKKTQNFSDYSS